MIESSGEVKSLNMKCVENQLIPVINQQILAFDIKKNTVKYSLGNEFNMLVLNTLLVDP